MSKMWLNKAQTNGQSNKCTRRNTVRKVRGTTLRSIYLTYVKTVMEYGCKIWFSRADQETGIYLVQSSQGDSQASNGTSGNILKKEVVVPPLRLRLEHDLASKLTRILFRVDHKNPVFKSIERN